MNSLETIVNFVERASSNLLFTYIIPDNILFIDL